MNSAQMFKECKILAKAQNLTFKRSELINRINGKACYVIESGVQHNVLHKGNMATIWMTLLSESLKGQ